MKQFDKSIVSGLGAPAGTGRLTLAFLSAALVTVLNGIGCDGGPTSPPAGAVAVPAPLELLLPQKIRLHPFTGTRVFGEEGGVKGIDVRIEAVDAYGDATKAFGQFRFELYAFQPNSQDPKGRQLSVWPADVSDPKTNRLHWDSITRAYQFKLAWQNPIAIGQKFVLRAIFESRFTTRLFDERVFVSGQ